MIGTSIPRSALPIAEPCDGGSVLLAKEFDGWWFAVLITCNGLLGGAELDGLSRAPIKEPLLFQRQTTGFTVGPSAGSTEAARPGSEETARLRANGASRDGGGATDSALPVEILWLKEKTERDSSETG